jgi:ABC-2 type transport system ATP-binding protein
MATSETIDHPAATNSGDAAAAVIQLPDLRHQYGDRTALTGVSFEVRPAEIFGLLGTNGSLF